MLLELCPAAESVRARDDQLRVGKREASGDEIRARMEFLRHRERVAVSGRQRGAQPFRVFSKMFERWIVRERTCRHSDLLTRASGLSGLWSAASGEEAACLRERMVGRAWPFPRTGGAPSARVHCNRLGWSRNCESQMTPSDTRQAVAISFATSHSR